MTSRRAQIGYVLLGLLVALVGLSFGGPLSGLSEPDETPPSGADDAPTADAESHPDMATVTFKDTDGTELGQVQAMVADTPDERYTGLSDTESLGPNEGMVFVYEEEDSRTFVMREMDFPIDMVFVGSDGRITEIYHAPVETDEDLTRYTGQAKWVVEVNQEWTTEHGISVGDQVNVTLPE